MRIPNIVVVSALLLASAAHGDDIFGPSTVSALDVGSPSNLADRDVIARLALREEPGSDISLDYFTVELLTDGTRRVRGQLTPRPGAPSESFFYFVDLVAGTYATFRSEAKPFLNEADHTSPAEKIGGEAGGKEGPPAPLLPEDDYCPCVDRCSGNWSLSVATLDPFFFVLTQTNADASWGVRGLYDPCRWYKTGSGTCTAAAPSEAGTNWFTSGCQRFGPYSSYKNLDLTVVGNYYNWDFGSNSERTDVNQTAQILLREGSGVSIQWSHSDSGEGSSLIFGHLTQSGSNDCF